MRVLAGFLLCVCSIAAKAQAGMPCVPGILSGGMVLGSAMRPGAPYYATVTTTFEQRLIDGNVISGEYRIHVAQNSEGWVRQEFGLNCVRDAEGKPQLNLHLMVTKNKPRETLSWMEGDRAGKEATLSRPIELTPEQRAAQLAKAKAQAGTRQTATAAMRAERQETRTESLGKSIIAGLEATGTRTIRTIPPGEEGNTLPLVVTGETWHTRDGLMVRWISDDPRRGRTVTEMETVALGEPDAALFAPPEGYTVKENPRMEAFAP
jgi:hypothetical protein